MFKRKEVKFTFLCAVIALTAFILWEYPINLGLDLQGGTRLILEATPPPDMELDNQAVLGTLAVIRNRVDALGVSEPLIQRKGKNQITVELPGIRDPDRAIKLIGETALMEFVEAEWLPKEALSLPKEKLDILVGKNARISNYIEKDLQGRIVRETPIVLKKTVLTGSDLETAFPGSDQMGRSIVNIEFKPEGSKKFASVTARWAGKPLAILLDGTIISAPNIKEKIAGGKAVISGSFTLAETRDLVIKLKAGALPIPVEIVSNKTVGPTLGRDSIEKSKKAGIVAFIGVCLFMILFYQIPGAVASVALVLYVGLTIACLKLFGATLTLPGIAGLILTLGMAVDANVIIFERIKEER